MQFDSDRERQVFAQVKHGISDLIRHLRDIGSEHHAELAADIHASLTRLQNGEYKNKEPLSMEEFLGKGPK